NDVIPSREDGEGPPAKGPVLQASGGSLAPLGTTNLGLASLGTTNRTLPPFDPSRPAYINFTSGSTGAPKAIVGYEAPVVHFLRWQRETFGITAGDRVSF